MSSIGRFEARFARIIERIVANDLTLKRVNFCGWEIGDEGAGRIVEALRGNTTIRYLHLGHNNISAALVRALANALEKSTSLKVLDLRGNNFGAEGARAVARLLRNNSSLVALYLRGCGIGVEGARALAGALRSNSSLTKIFLRENSIGVVGASLLARSLPGNSTLIVLDLEGNYISDVGARELAGSLPHNSSVTTVNLGGNSIRDVSARLLVKALLINFSVVTLTLESNDFAWAQFGLEPLVTEIAQINADAPNPQEALELKIAWLRTLDERRLRLLGFEERGVEGEIRRLRIVSQVVRLIGSGVEGEKEEAVTLVIDQLEHFVQAERRRDLFWWLLGAHARGVDVASSVDTTRGRALYWYAAQCGAAPEVLMNVLRAHPSLCTCKDVQHRLHPFMLLATIPEAGVGDVMELLQMNPNLVGSGICQDATNNKRKRESSAG